MPAVLPPAPVRLPATPLALWGGIECTHTRVGTRRVDQLAATGHAARDDDLERCAALGITTLRYPVLWERVMARRGAADWAWTDTRLNRLRERGITVVGGLVHHGSGPGHCSLNTPAFARGLAGFAAQAARRYPWVEDWTPINEPLTTARFCGLYGHWWPHGRDDTTFLRLLLRELDGVRAAMQTIRRVTPRARLVQTDDLGHTWSTAPLAAQAAFENERRWLAWDLLCGRVGPEHALFGWLRRHGVTRAVLDRWQAEPCVPDLLGINHYLSSERFLDHRVELYPPALRGGNGRQAYADIEAHRALPDGCAGPQALLQAAWERYRLPLAITEAHNGCTRDEQLRWFVEVWRAADALAAAGVPVRAVTAWALFGSSDWDSLLTRAAGHYEPGVFDARCDPPRATALVPVLQRLARGEAAQHPLLALPGWWQRAGRFHALPELQNRPRPGPAGRLTRTCRPLVIVGAHGTLGQALARACVARGLPYRLFSRTHCDLARDQTAALQRWRPWAVINASGCVAVDGADTDVHARRRCWRDNTTAVARLAATCAALHLPLVTFSSDLVFDGRKSSPYDESDAVAPLSVYGRSKAAAEIAVQARHPEALIVRTSAFFGPHDPWNFAATTRATLAAGAPLPVADDVIVSPTYVPDLADAVLDLLIDGAHGLWHLANRGALSWFDFARAIAAVTGLDAGLLQPVPSTQMPWLAPRPRHSALASRRGLLLPPLDQALDRYARACRA